MLISEKVRASYSASLRFPTPQFQDLHPTFCKPTLQEPTQSWLRRQIYHSKDELDSCRARCHLATSCSELPQNKHRSEWRTHPKPSRHFLVSQNSNPSSKQLFFLPTTQLEDIQSPCPPSSTPSTTASPRPAPVPSSSMALTIGINNVKPPRSMKSSSSR